MNKVRVWITSGGMFSNKVIQVYLAITFSFNNKNLLGIQSLKAKVLICKILAILQRYLLFNSPKDI